MIGVLLVHIVVFDKKKIYILSFLFKMLFNFKKLSHLQVELFCLV